jgi:hypothetical protein
MQKRHRSRSASYPTAPAQIPACGIIAPGSSEILTSRSTHPIALSVWASGPFKPSPSTPQCQALLRLFRGCIKLQEVRSSLWPVSFPVYASIVSFGFRLLYNCNTRYEWLVRPYSPGTFTLEETPSFPWRTNGVRYLLAGGRGLGLGAGFR